MHPNSLEICEISELCFLTTGYVACTACEMCEMSPRPKATALI